MIITEEDIARRFGYHSPDDGGKLLIEDVRHQFVNLATIISKAMPDSREARTAITKLEEAAFWATASIARQFPLAEPILSADAMRG